MVQIDPCELPRHIGVIMDGNGRWAQKRGKKRTAGHRAGAQAVRRVVRTCRKLSIENLTLYAFSAQNWGRPEEEIAALMDLLGQFIIDEWQEIMDRDIRVMHLGDLRRIPALVRERFRKLIAASKHNKSMTLALALNYGAREELVRAAKNLVRRASKGKLEACQVTEELLSRSLYTCDLPDPDLIIRTGGESRVSNFLLWQSAYAELFFSEILWPDFKKEHLISAIFDFQQRRRRFGLTDEQQTRKNNPGGE
jgi:undecaprenyl diphosphate synthase